MELKARQWRECAARLQAAAMDASLWPEAIGAVSDAVGGLGALLKSSDTRFQGFPVTPSLAEQAAAYVRTGWHLRDERLRGVPAMRVKGVVTDDDCAPPERRARSAYYQDFLPSIGLGEFAGLGFVAGGDLWCLSVQRARGQAAFSDSDKRLLLSLWRPLNDAAAVARALGFARARGAAEALETTRQAAIVFDGAGRVLALNARAEALVGDSLDVARRELSLSDRRSQERWSTLLAHAIDGLPEAAPRALVSVVLDSRGRKLPIRAVTLRGFADYAFANSRALLLIDEPAGEPAESGRGLAERFGLTAAEARLAGDIASGAALAEIAERRGVSYQTARSQLRSVFAKTGTHRQGELVALLAALRR